MVPCLHIADIGTAGQGLHLSERSLHRVSLILYTECILQGTIACFKVPNIIFQGTLVYPKIPGKFHKYCF